MADIVASEMIDNGVKFHFKCIPTSISKTEEGKLLVNWKNMEDNTE